MMTAKGIYLYLGDSTYFYKYEKYKFYFSSKIYREKFLKKVETYCREEKLKFEAKYNTIVTNSVFFAFVLYSKIEKRGFRVEEIDYSNSKKIFQKIESIPFVDLRLL